MPKCQHFAVGHERIAASRRQSGCLHPIEGVCIKGSEGGVSISQGGLHPLGWIMVWYKAGVICHMRHPFIIKLVSVRLTSSLLRLSVIILNNTVALRHESKATQNYLH